MDKVQHHEILLPITLTLTRHHASRNFELCNIQAGHIDHCLSVRCPENLEYFTVELVNWKGWMVAKGCPDGPLKGMYKLICQSPSDNAYDILSHMAR